MRRRIHVLAQRVLRDAPPGRRLRIATAVDELEAFAGGRPLRVLDAGAEEGLLCLALAARHPDWTLVAVDHAAEPLARGQRWARTAGARVAYVRADLTRPLADAGFDAVVALECLMEVPDDRAALAALAAALRPGGLFLAQVPTHDWTPVLRGSERTWRREVRHGYRADELRAWLAAAGLTVVDVRGTFHRATALAQDWRDAVKRRSTATRLLAVPAQLAAVRAERLGLRIGRPRAWFVVAAKR